ncbi:MAG: NAD-dependent protein deacetylase [Planctomycetaceae bacterium]|nr:NAD-dependent protein deacetylase [Planctomycetaceae bacterium]
MTEPLDELIGQAAELIREAGGLLIGAGAGMSVDSGLPDFRGDEGFWNAYPPFKGRRFAEMSNPVWFHRDPIQAWGFFGHRLNLYRGTEPHAGFSTLLKWANACSSYFVFTSNVDGHFQRAGFDTNRIIECHGSIYHLQCVNLCTHQIWEAADLAIEVDESTIRAAGSLPKCPDCGGLARPNILMFGDWDWIEDRTAEQSRRFQSWQQETRGMKIVSLEFGAGLAIPTVRHQCEGQMGRLIRVNPREPEVPQGDIGLPIGALEAISRIDERL